MKLQTLDKIMKEFNLPIDVYVECKNNLHYSANHDIDDVQQFIDDLPHLLKIQFSLVIHEQKYQIIKFLNKKSLIFITWLCPLLKPYNF